MSTGAYTSRACNASEWRKQQDRGSVSPLSDALPPLVFPSGGRSLGESSRTQLEQGMREMSLVLKDLIKGSCQDWDSSWGLDLEGRRLGVGRPERNFDPNERFHGDPMVPGLVALAWQSEQSSDSPP